MTHFKIIARGKKSTEQEMPRKLCLQRVSINDLCPGGSMDAIAKKIDEFIANHGPLSYKVEFAEFALNPELRRS